MPGRVRSKYILTWDYLITERRHVADSNRRCLVDSILEGDENNRVLSCSHFTPGLIAVIWIRNLERGKEYLSPFDVDEIELEFVDLVEPRPYSALI